MVIEEIMHTNNECDNCMKEYIYEYTLGRRSEVKMTTVGELKKVLENMKAKHNTEISAVISKSGIPIVWNIPEDVHLETFATLSATILGASEVIFTGMDRNIPKRVIVETESENLIAVSLGPKALLVAISSATPEELTAIIEEAATTIKGVLAHEE
jgi:predicted regulator of Ras-like GTPase activity (Roadblock/LC7/MglB family)